MSEVLNNITTTDEYNPDNSIEANYKLDRISLRVYNAAVYRQLLVGLSDNPRSARWQGELLVAPGQEVIRRAYLFGVRVRSAAAGEPAQVTAETIAKGE